MSSSLDAGAASVAESSGAMSAARAKPNSCFFGRPQVSVTLVLSKPTYACTTSEPFTGPVFFTSTVNCTVPVSVTVGVVTCTFE